MKLRSSVFRLYGLMRKRRLDLELDDEILAHLEMAERDAIAAGMSPEEAREAARRSFGGIEQMKENHRDCRSVRWIENLLRDVRYGLASLRRNPGFTIVALLTLSIGIGANSAVFSVVNSVLLKPLPYPNAEELVAVRQFAPGAAGLANISEGLRLSPSMYFTFAEQNRTFQALGVWVTLTANVTGLAEPEQVRTVNISDGALQVLGVQPTLGRWLGKSDQTPGGPETVMLSFGYWQRRFGGDRSVIGRRIMVDSRPREVIGVMPEGFRFVNADFDLIVPLAFDRSSLSLPGFGFPGIARLKPRMSITQANADLARMLPIWMYSWPFSGNPRIYDTWRITPALHPLKQEVVGDVGDVLWVVMGTIGLVMLIACANVTNLFLVRVEARQQELALRAALGAGRGRIVQSLLAESLMLGLMGARSEQGSLAGVSVFCRQLVRRICPV